MNDSSPVLTIEEAAKLLRIGRSSAYEAARTGELPTIRIGRRILVPRARVMQMLEQGGLPAPAPPALVAAGR